MRLSGTKATAIHQYRGLGNQLWDLAGNRPSLDLRFAESKSLVDATTGTNLIDFTRASSGTYVGSDGLIKTATTNLLRYSEEADNPAWNILSSSITVDPNVTVSPDGAQTADKIKEATTTGSHSSEFTGFAFEAGTTYTVSFYAKAVERSRFRVTWPVVFTNRLAFIDIDPVTYSVISDGGTISSVTPVGNDWFRVVSTSTCTSTTAGSRIGVTLVDTDTNVIYTGDGTSGLYIWGAQLEQSSTVGEYIPTTSTINSAPRFDHDPTTGESLGLLVEESRTNAVNRSESDFGVASAIKTDDVVVAPDGNTTADQFESTGGGAFKAGIPVTNGTQVTYSVFLKKISGSGIMTSVGFNAFGSTNINGKVRVDLNDGTISNLGALVEDSSITAYSNGWYRVSVTATATDTTAVVINYCDIGQVGAHTFSAWGMQVEEGSFPTSYIPTEGSTVTRAADVASITGANFSSWYRQDEGTVFADYRPTFAETSSNKTMALFAINDNSNDNAIQFFRRAISGNQSIFNVRISGSNVIFLDTGIWSTNQTKLSAAYKVNDFASVINAGTIQTDTTGAIPAVSQILIGNAIPDAYASSHIRRLVYWNQRLPNEVLQTITQ